MTTKIAVRLPDDLVACVDEVARDEGLSRAVVVARALTSSQRHVLAQRDARILRESGDYDDFDRLFAHRVSAGPW